MLVCPACTVTYEIRIIVADVGNPNPSTGLPYSGGYGDSMLVFKEASLSDNAQYLYPPPPPSPSPPAAAYDRTTPSTIPGAFVPFSTLSCYAWDDNQTVSDDGSTQVPIMDKNLFGSNTLYRDNLNPSDLAAFLVGPGLLASGAVTIQNANINSSLSNCGQFAVVNFTQGERACCVGATRMVMVCASAHDDVCASVCPLP
jgi:hypothetical protein